MTALLNFLTLLTATCFAAAAAIALQWILLRTAVRLMRPATARRVGVRSHSLRGTLQLARAFAPRR
jgi:hypothetical protein